MHPRIPFFRLAFKLPRDVQAPGSCVQFASHDSVRRHSHSRSPLLADDIFSDAGIFPLEGIPRAEDYFAVIDFQFNYPLIGTEAAFITPALRSTARLPRHSYHERISPFRPAAFFCARAVTPESRSHSQAPLSKAPQSRWTNLRIRIFEPWLQSAASS